MLQSSLDFSKRLTPKHILANGQRATEGEVGYQFASRSGVALIL